MAKMEHLEMDARRRQLTDDVNHRVEKFRSIFDWDIPEVNRDLSHRLIVEALRQALADIEAKSSVGSLKGTCRQLDCTRFGHK